MNIGKLFVKHMKSAFIRLNTHSLKTYKELQSTKIIIVVQLHKLELKHDLWKLLIKMEPDIQEKVMSNSQSFKKWVINKKELSVYF